jgi:DNA-binding SARP family transcriptional activator
MQYRILGPIEVLDDEGRPVPLGGQREKVLLATLLLEANRVVSADRLIEAVWGDDPPATAANALQVHVSKLRKRLAAPSGSGGSLEMVPPGYVLQARVGEVDAERFVKASGVAVTDDDPFETRARLADALSLWRGPALDGLVSDALRADANRLEELRVAVLELRIEADLALGGHAQLVAELEQLVHSHPLREGLRAKLMLALYRSGRQADALAVYRQTRRMLADELGIDPSPALQGLELAILHQSPELNAPIKVEEAFEATHSSQPSVGKSLSGSTINIVPLPWRIAVRPPIGVVGRETEMGLIGDAFKRVSNREGREVVLISGEAGLGKTTLVAETARAAFDAGACVLLGHCEEDLTNPYQLFVEALGHLVTHATEEQLLAHIESHGSELSRLVPALADRISDLPPSKATDSDTKRFLLFASAVGLLATLSQYQAIVLVLDDLQWADKGSLLLLRHLTLAEQTMRVLVLGTYRDSELSQSHPLTDTLAALHRQSGFSHIGLTGLDDEGVKAMLEASAGQTLDDAGVGLAHALHRETDGNPFFVSEVLRNLNETGAIYQDAAGRWKAEVSLDQIALPDSVRVVIGARVGRLGKDAERVLLLASVIGRDFDLDLLARVTKASEDDLLDILDAAAAAALVREVAATGRYAFAHALIQHTLYEDLGHNRRARAHRQVGQALEEICGDRPTPRVGELARHWFSATQPVDLAKAISYSRLAGDAALAALAPADALRYYAQALDLYPQATDPDPVLGIDLAIGLGTAQRQTGDPGFSGTLLGAARRAADLGDTERLVATALANNRGVVSSVIGLDTDKVEILETALDRLPTDNPDRALVLATLCAEVTYKSPLNRLEALADEAIAIAQTSGDDEVIVRVLNLVFDPLQVPPLLEQSLARSTDALIRAKRLGDPVLLFFAAGFRVVAAARCGDVHEMDRCLEVMGSSAGQLDQPMLTWALTIWRAGRAMIAGDADQAERLATEALQIGTDSGQPDATLLFGMQVVSVSFQRGTLSDLVPLIEQMAAEMSDPPPSIAGFVAAAYVEGGRIHDAMRLLEQFAASDFKLPWGQDWIHGMVSFAEAAIECADPTYAGPLFDQLDPWADQWSCNPVQAEGPVSHFLGGLATVLGRYDEADAYFTQAAAASYRVDAKFFAARTDLSWARMLAKRHALGDIEKARYLLTKTHTAAANDRYGTVERRALATLQALN